MAKEIELKLLLDSKDIDPLRLLLDQSASYQQQAELLNSYFDTPTWQLQQHKCALRIRQASDTFEQTFKTQGYEENGLQVRGEWNWPLASKALNTALLATPEVVKHWPAGVNLAELQEIFSTDFQRRTWHWQTATALVEVALDIGTITALAKQEPLVELELELLSGEPQELWQIMRRIEQSIPLQPSAISKAARGYALAQQSK